jgi:hypothetical protein
MAIPPGTKFKRVSRAELEQEFDKLWEPVLRHTGPRTPQSPLANPELRFPSGARAMLCIFVGADGFDLAIANKFVTCNGQILTDRTYHPTGLMVDGVWWH